MPKNVTAVTAMMLFGALAGACVMAVLLLPWYYATVLCLTMPILALVFCRPDLGAYALIFLIPFTTATVFFSIQADWNFFVGHRRINSIPMIAPFVLFAFMGHMLRKMSELNPTPPENILTVPVAIVLTYAGCTVWWSDAFNHSLFQFLLLTMNVAVFVLFVIYIKEEKQLALAVTCFVGSGLIQAWFHFLFFFLDSFFFNHEIFKRFVFFVILPGGYFQPSGMPQTDGGFMDHHELALMANLCLALCLGLIQAKPAVMKKSTLVFIISTLVMVVLHTQSRGGIGAMILMILFALMAFRVTRNYVIRVFPVVAVAVLGLYLLQATVVAVITGKTTTPRLFALGKIMVEKQNLIDPGSEKNKGRGPLWKKSFDNFKGNAIQGFGVGNLKRISKAPHAHNISLSLIFDFGILGLISLVFIIGILLKRFIVLLGHQSTYSQIMAVAFGTGLVAIGFHGQFDFEYNTTLLWLYLGLTVAAFRISFQSFSPMKTKTLRTWS